MSSNKSVKERMIKKYGPECWIEKLHLRPVDEPRKYKSKGERKRMKELTFHHIKEKRNGGQTTEENGAILSEENHIWFNNQPEEVQRKLNEIFQEYKKQFNILNGDNIEVIYNNQSRILTYDEFMIQAKKSYNRAKEKRESRKFIQDEINLNL